MLSVPTTHKVVAQGVTPLAPPTWCSASQPRPRIPKPELPPEAADAGRGSGGVRPHRQRRGGVGAAGEHDHVLAVDQPEPEGALANSSVPVLTRIVS